MSVLVPEFSVYSVLRNLSDKLRDGSLWNEPTTLAGIEKKDLDDFVSFMQKKPPQVGFVYPQSPTEIPSITITPDTWGTDTPLLGEYTGTEPRGIVSVVGEVLVGTAVGGEITFQLDHIDAVPQSQIVYKNDVVLSGSDYSFDADGGVLTLATPLLVEESLKIDYSYYSADAPALEFTGEVSRMSIRVFITTNHPVTTMLLAALVWRELTATRDGLEDEGGVKNLDLSVQTLSEWDQVLPAVGFRRDVVLNFLAEQRVAKKVFPPKRVTVAISAGEPSEPVVEVTRGIPG